MGLRTPFGMKNSKLALDAYQKAADRNMNPANIDMTTAQGQRIYRNMSKDQRAAFDAKQQQNQLTQAERNMQNILNKAPKYASAMQSPEFSQFKSEAYGTGPLAEYDAMRKQAKLAAEQGRTRLGQQLTDEMGNLSLNQAGQTANAYSQLAQGGGLSSGARERIAGSMGQQSMAARQAARLQSQRQGQDLESQLAQGEQDLLAKESAARRGMQNTYMDMLAKDVAAKSAFDQSMYGKRADVEAGLAKARMDATMNAYKK